MSSLQVIEDISNLVRRLIIANPVYWRQTVPEMQHMSLLDLEPQRPAVNSIIYHSKWGPDIFRFLVVIMNSAFNGLFTINGLLA